MRSSLLPRSCVWVMNLDRVNFVFTALILGFTTVKTKLTLKRILGTVWHEGMPMLLYAQALIWGEHSPSPLDPLIPPRPVCPHAVTHLI